MFTLGLLPNFKGTKKEFIKALAICLVLDACIILAVWFA
jgi:hypothetical protein